MSEKSMLSFLPPPVRAVVDRAVDFVKNMSRPAKILVGSTLVVAIALVAYMSVKSANPPYSVLFANLEPEDAAAVVAKLKEQKVPYRLENERTIEVPEAQARELRLELAGAGLPRGGAVGFESFDKMRLGATEFEQRILYRRAQEGELARTIGSLSAVQNARVHLVMPEKSVFVAKNEPASASIVLKLRPGRALGAGEVAGIVHLVSSSVAGLSGEHVAVVTTEGLVLHKPRKSGAGAEEEENGLAARSLEANLEERARAMVEKFLGPGRADVRVSAELDPSRIERVEDRYDPTKSVLRSEERSVERSGEGDMPATGVPGAESNLPTGAAAADAGAGPAPGVQRESHTRNFEVDHVTEKRTTAAGQLRRLTVAVVVDDHGTPRTKEELDKIASLVRSAVGADDKRGDLVTVEAMTFQTGESANTATPPVASNVLLTKAMPYAPAAGGAVVLLVIAAVVVAKRKKAKKAKESLKTELRSELPSVTTSAEVEAALVEADPEEIRRLVHERVTHDPATAALVLRSWLGQLDEGVNKDPAKKEAA